MTRVKGGNIHKNRRKKIMNLAKGYFGSKHRLYKTAKEQVMHSLSYAYRDRRQNKREFRKLWITRINAACRQNDISYSKFINGLSKAGITLLGVGVSAGTRATLRNATEQIISSFPLEVYQRDTICIIANFKASIDGRKLVQEMSDAVESIENAIPLDPYSIIGGSIEADLGDTKQAYLIISII